MRRDGFTLIELIVGIVASAILALATAALVRAGIMTYTYCMRQNNVLDAARKSLAYGDAGRKGLVWSGQVGTSVNGILSSSMTVVADTNYSTYYLSNQNLQLHAGNQTNTLATYISTVSYSYYNMNDSGLIMVSTAANMARLMTFQVTMQGAASQKTYYFYTGAELRNHQ